MSKDAASLTLWEQKAHEVIARYCHESWLRTNTSASGRRYKEHRPYVLPEIAAALVKALGIHDSRAREYEIKRLFEVEQLGVWSLI